MHNGIKKYIFKEFAKKKSFFRAFSIISSSIVILNKIRLQKLTTQIKYIMSHKYSIQFFFCQINIIYPLDTSYIITVIKISFILLYTALLKLSNRIYCVQIITQNICTYRRSFYKRHKKKFI